MIQRCGQIAQTFPSTEPPGPIHFFQDRNNIGKVALTPKGLDQGPCRHRLTKRYQGNHADVKQNRAESLGEASDRVECPHEDEPDRLARGGDLAAC